MSVGDALDLEAGVFEVEEEGGFEAGDVEVSMGVINHRMHRMHRVKSEE